MINPNLKNLLGFIRKEYPEFPWVAVYSITVAGLSLVVPLAVQAIVSNVTLGIVSQTIFFLILGIFFGLSLYVVLSLFQTWLVELLHRRFLISLTDNVSNIICDKKEENYDIKLEKFYEFSNIQKSVKLIILDSLSLFLQVFTGIIVLIFYHPIFIIFVAFILLFIFGIFYFAGNGVFETASKESYAKYALVQSLRDLGKATDTSLGSAGVRDSLVTYLQKRSKNFKIVFRQAILSGILLIFGSTLLLALGVYLVVSKQLTLGQLVASEIIITVILTSVFKFQKNIEAFFSLNASIEKLNTYLHFDIKGKRHFTRSSFAPIPKMLKKSVRYSIFIVLFFVSALTFLPWVQTGFGSGQVVAYLPNDRIQTLNAPIEGRIVKWHVSEGEIVRKGQIIVELSDNDPQIIDRLTVERTAIEQRMNAASSALTIAKLNVDRQKVLYDKGLSARKTFEDAQIAYQRLLMDQANAAAELSRIDVRLARQQTQVIRSPFNGAISKILPSHNGSRLVKSGETLATIVPNTNDRAIELYVDGIDLPLIWVGRKVRILFEGWPAIQFSGWPSASVGTFGGIVKVIDPFDNGDGKFRILVVPDPQSDWPEPNLLRQGVRAQGWVLFETVPLGFEIWRKANGFPPNLTSSSEKKDTKNATQK
jgi:multidrug efflux pump subunit AcrA (membrane-fusion protein)